MRVMLIVCFIAFSVLPVSAFEIGSRSILDTPAPPNLIYPRGEEAAVQNDGFLEFSWRDMYAADTDHYVFRLYKGYQTSEANLVCKQDIPEEESSFKVNASSLDNNQIYTWSIQRFNSSGRKSDQVWNSFRVIKN